MADNGYDPEEENRYACPHPGCGVIGSIKNEDTESTCPNGHYWGPDDIESWTQIEWPYVPGEEE